MSIELNNQILTQEEVNVLEEKLACVFTDIGTQIGTLIRELVKAELQVDQEKIKQLNNILNGTVV